MTNTTKTSATHVGKIIIGSGFAGLGMAIQLKRRDDTDFAIIERANDVGGTWRDNHYPGVACDVPSHLYSFSYLPNPEWSRVFSPGPEIQAYMRKCAEDEGLLEHIHFGADMQKSVWNEAEKQWEVTTSKGLFIAPILITGTGHLADGFLPNIKGLDSFEGEVFHSADWNHSADLKGKRIGVVGSGASAIQIIPEMQKVAGEMVVFQRSAPYMVPRPDRAFTPAERQLFRRDPETVEALRSEIFWGGEYNFAQRRNIPRYLQEAKDMATSHLENLVPDLELRAKLTPNYEVGCKRLLISDAYYPAMGQDNVTLEASALSHIEGSKVYGADNEEPYELDALVFATGFEVTQPPFANRIYGTKGHSLNAQWDQGMQAMDSTTVHGFPNLFIINGPNTGLGHNSVVYIIEAQVEYILGALDYAAENNLSVLEASEAAEIEYMDRLHETSQGSIWLDGGCKSWYVDDRSGRLTVIWPDFAHTFRGENAQFNSAGYIETKAG